MVILEVIFILVRCLVGLRIQRFIFSSLVITFLLVLYS